MQLKHLDCVAVHNQTKSFLKDHFFMAMFSRCYIYASSNSNKGDCNLMKKHLVEFKSAINATPKMISPLLYVMQMQLHIRLGVIHKLR